MDNLNNKNTPKISSEEIDESGSIPSFSTTEVDVDDVSVAISPVSKSKKESDPKGNLKKSQQQPVKTETKINNLKKTITQKMTAEKVTNSNIETENKLTPQVSKKLRECPVCNGKVSRNAAACPHCGEPDPFNIIMATNWTVKLFWTAVIVGGVYLCYTEVLPMIKELPVVQQILSEFE